MPELLLLVLRTFVAAIRSRRDLALENLVLRDQLQVALRSNPHPRIRAPDRVLWVWLRRLWPEVGASTFGSCSRRQSYAGIGRAGDCIGPGSREPGSVVPISAPRGGG